MCICVYIYIYIYMFTTGGWIKTDKTFKSSVDGIYAAGDVIGPPSLASTGVFQAYMSMYMFIYIYI